MNFLTLLSIAYSFSLGVSESGYEMWQSNLPSCEFRSTSVETEFNIDLVYWRFYLGGGVNTPSKCTNGVFKPGGYNPQWNNYLFEAGYMGKYFNIGYEHRCIHPVMAYLHESSIDYKKEGAYDKVFVQFKHEWRPFK